MNNNSVSQVYVLRPDGNHSGPISMETLARGILDGSIARDALIAPLGAQQWTHASQLPEAISVIETVRRASSAPPPPVPTQAPRPPSVSPISARPPAAQQIATMPSAVAPPTPAPQPVAMVAPATAPAPAQIRPPAPAAAAPAPAPAAAKPAAAAAAQPAAAALPKAKPWPKHLSLAIFGAFAVIGLLECIAAAALTPKDASAEGEPTAEQAAAQK